MKILIVSPVKSGTHLVENMFAEILNTQSIHLNFVKKKFISIKDALEISNIVSTHHFLFSKDLTEYIKNNNVKVIRLRRNPEEYTNSVLNWDLITNFFPSNNFNKNLKLFLNLDSTSFVWTMQYYLDMFHSWNNLGIPILDLDFSIAKESKLLFRILRNNLNLECNDFDIDKYSIDFEKNIIFTRRYSNTKVRFNSDIWSKENIEIYNKRWKEKFSKIGF